MVQILLQDWVAERLNSVAGGEAEDENDKGYDLPSPDGEGLWDVAAHDEEPPGGVGQDRQILLHQNKGDDSVVLDLAATHLVVDGETIAGLATVPLPFRTAARVLCPFHRDLWNREGFSNTLPLMLLQLLPEGGAEGGVWLSY